MGTSSQMNLFRGRLKKLLLAVVVMSGISSPFSMAIAQTAGDAAANVEVQGATRGDQDTIRAYFKGTGEAAVNRGVADLTATGMYKKVSAKAVGGKILVSVEEGGLIINRVAFDGGNKLKGEQLAVEVQSKARSAFDEETAKGDIDRIKEAYKKVGRSAVKVSYRLVNLPNGRVDLVFTVDEGDKTGIKSINFVGNQTVSSYRLRSLMQLTEMNFLSWFKTSDVYNPDTLATDEETIRKYYMRYGYADFRIVNTDVRYLPDQSGYNITITVEEGPVYRVSSESVTSHLTKVDGAALERFVLLHHGDVYNATLVEKSIESITRYLAGLGYPFADVRPHGERNNTTHEIALAFSVDDAPKVYIERVDIVGNTRTRDYVIRREFDIGEGDPYNHTLIEKAERRLNNLDFFKSVHISTRPGSSADRVVVTVNVEDKPTGSVSLSGGYSTTEGAIAEVSFTETNFLGRGQYVKLSVSEGQYSKGWSATFTEPYFLDQRLAAGIDVFHKEQDVNPYAEYETWTTGVNLRLGVPITDEFTFQPNYSIYASQIVIPDSQSQPYGDCGPQGNGFGGSTVWNYPGIGNQTASPNYNCLTNGEASIAIKEAAAQGTIVTSLVGYSLIWDSLDNRKNPTTGLYASLHQDIAGLGGQSEFVRETLDTRYYYPVTDDLTAMFRIQGGQITGFGSEKNDLPIIDNFNLGPTLVRGFAPGGIGPRDVTDPNNISTNGLGGTTYWGGSTELQFPIFGLPKELGLRGAVFADAGSLYGFSDKTDFSGLLGYSYCPAAGSSLITQPSCLRVDDEQKIRSSVGVSVLWASPIGPLRFDLAYPITKGKYDQTQYFNFSGGASF
jgi:outer membrane protein insertion porin family